MTRWGGWARGELGERRGFNQWEGGGMRKEEASAWEKRDRGCEYLIKRPMNESSGESGSTIPRGSCPMEY